MTIIDELKNYNLDIDDYTPQKLADLINNLPDNILVHGDSLYTIVYKIILGFSKKKSTYKGKKLHYRGITFDIDDLPVDLQKILYKFCKILTI